MLIGDDAGLSGCAICAAERIEIGAGSLLGSGVTILDTDLHGIGSGPRRRAVASAAPRPVVIGRNVFVGMGTLILKGVTIGDDAVIGAGSVVTTDIPPNVVAAGVPARVVSPVEKAASPVQGEA